MALGIVALLATTNAAAVQIEGFTEPYQTIAVAASETGIVREIKVGEGGSIQPGQVLAELDRDVHVAALKIAQQSMETKGTLNFALAELQLKRQRLSKLEVLRVDGHARQEVIAWRCLLGYILVSTGTVVADSRSLNDDLRLIDRRPDGLHHGLSGVKAAIADAALAFGGPASGGEAFPSQVDNCVSTFGQ